MIFPILKTVRISKLKSEHTSCSICGEKLISGKHYLTIIKICQSGSPVQLWTHIKCIETLKNELDKRYTEEIKRKIMVEDL
jgi:hypothetical protein